MFVKKQSVALKFILQTSAEITDNATLPTDLSIFRDKKSDLLLTTPSEMIKQLTQRETTALSPDPLPRVLNFP